MKIEGVFLAFDEFDYKPVPGNASLWTIQNPRGLFGFLLTDGRRIIVPDGFVFDGTSIPRVAWPVFGPRLGFGKRANHAPAAALHDPLYETGRIEGKPITRRVADQVFLAACDRAKVSRGRRRWMYSILRMFGGIHWRYHERRGDHA